MGSGCPRGPIETLQGFGILRLPRKQTRTDTGQVSLLSQERLNDFSDPDQILDSTNLGPFLPTSLSPAPYPIAFCGFLAGVRGASQAKDPPLSFRFSCFRDPSESRSRETSPGKFSYGQDSFIQHNTHKDTWVPIHVLITPALCVYTLCTVETTPLPPQDV